MKKVQTFYHNLVISLYRIMNFKIDTYDKYS